MTAITNCAAWEAAGHPAGFVWGVEELDVYPGAKYVRDSAVAAEWSSRLRQPMHEVRITTNAQRIRLVFHAVHIHKIAQGKPDPDELAPIDPIDLLSPVTDPR